MISNIDIKIRGKGQKDMNKDAEIKKIVMARLSTFPSDRKICIGNYGELTRDDMLTHVRCGDKIGEKIIEIELAYLRALKKGIIKLY